MRKPFAPSTQRGKKKKLYEKGAGNCPDSKDGGNSKLLNFPVYLRQHRQLFQKRAFRGFCRAESLFRVFNQGK